LSWSGIEPLIYLAVAVALLTMRVKWRRQQSKPAPQSDTAKGT